MELQILTFAFSAELEMTVNMLIQIDKLVQLLESPVFTCKIPVFDVRWLEPNVTRPDLRLQLLEPEKYPYLYKCLYGLLMLLPQSSAFAALKNRLNSVSNIGLLQSGPRRYAFAIYRDSKPVLTDPPSSAQTAPPYDRPSGTRLKPRDENTIRWVDLLDKFKYVQERTRRSQATQRHSLDPSDSAQHPSLTAALSAAAAGRDRSGLPDSPRGGVGMMGSGAGGGLGMGGAGSGVGGAANRGIPEATKASTSSLLGSAQRSRSSLSNLGRLGIGGRKSKR